jgi:hypothetical protein
VKKFLKIILFLFLIALAYHFRAQLVAKFLLFQRNLGTLFVKAPCSEPIPYALGTFDNQFNISKSYFLSALSDAEVIWEKPLGKDLFAYMPAASPVDGLWPRDSASDVLKINLIYDYRQQATSKLASLGIIVKDNQASYNMLKAKFTELQAKITVAKSDYELSKSETTRIKINEMIAEANSMVVVLNRLIDTLNLSVEKYNTTSASRGESFEEGIYMSDGSNREIDIYEFSNRAKLVRVLAHELGHALDLEHVDDTKAIMYKLNQSSSLTLTQSDLNELKTKCGIK